MKCAGYYHHLWKVFNCFNLEIRKEFPSPAWHLTLCNIFFSQELLIKINVFQQTVVRQGLPCNFWLALKQPERKKLKKMHRTEKVLPKASGKGSVNVLMIQKRFTALFVIITTRIEDKKKQRWTLKKRTLIGPLWTLR